VERFGVWEKALGIDWNRYLNELVENRLTGESAREVALYLLSKGK